MALARDAALEAEVGGDAHPPIAPASDPAGRGGPDPRRLPPLVTGNDGRAVVAFFTAEDGDGRP
jgi:hypothetical protein